MAFITNIPYVDLRIMRSKRGALYDAVVVERGTDKIVGRLPISSATLDMPAHDLGKWNIGIYADRVEEKIVDVQGERSSKAVY
jgi:hypothetical protein